MDIVFSSNIRLNEQALLHVIYAEERNVVLTRCGYMLNNPDKLVGSAHSTAFRPCLRCNSMDGWKRRLEEHHNALAQK